MTEPTTRVAALAFSAAKAWTPAAELWSREPADDALAHALAAEAAVGVGDFERATVHARGLGDAFSGQAWFDEVRTEVSELKALRSSEKVSGNPFTNLVRTRRYREALAVVDQNFGPGGAHMWKADLLFRLGDFTASADAADEARALLIDGRAKGAPEGAADKVQRIRGNLESRLRAPPEGAGQAYWAGQHSLVKALKTRTGQPKPHELTELLGLSIALDRAFGVHEFTPGLMVINGFLNADACETVLGHPETAGERLRQILGGLPARSRVENALLAECLIRANRLTEIEEVFID